MFCHTFWWWFPFHSVVDTESNSDILIFWYSYSRKTRDYIEANKTSIGCTDFSSQLPTVVPFVHMAHGVDSISCDASAQAGRCWIIDLSHVFCWNLISIHVGSIKKLFTMFFEQSYHHICCFVMFFYNIWTLSGRLGWTLHGLKQPQLPGCHCWPCLPSSITRCLAAPMEQRLETGGFRVNTSREWIMSHELCAFNIFLGWLVITVDTFLFDD